MDNKKQLKEGILVKIVDNFFKGLQQGVADKYAEAAKKAGAHPEMVNAMKRMSDENENFRNTMKKYGF
jgi:hypothetical protein